MSDQISPNELLEYEEVLDDKYSERPIKDRVADLIGCMTHEEATIRTNESVKVVIDSTNTGNVVGEEVVQMCRRGSVSSATRPVKELKGLQKTSLNPVESKTVSLPVFPEHLNFTAIDMHHTVEAGDFQSMDGNLSRDEDLKKLILRVI